MNQEERISIVNPRRLEEDEDVNGFSSPTDLPNTEISIILE